ncbi:MAG: hypothetical protein ACR2Q4_23980 [Geminicoccaceae bacterium]
MRKLRSLAERTGVTLEYVPGRSKGSHGTIYYGDRISRLKCPQMEIGKGFFAAMCKQLGIAPDDLD